MHAAHNLGHDDDTFPPPPFTHDEARDAALLYADPGTDLHWFGLVGLVTPAALTEAADLLDTWDRDNRTDLGNSECCQEVARLLDYVEADQIALPWAA